MISVFLPVAIKNLFTLSFKLYDRLQNFLTFKMTQTLGPFLYRLTFRQCVTITFFLPVVNSLSSQNKSVNAILLSKEKL